MAEVSIRDLRNRGGEIVDRVAAGEHVTITRSGKPVASLTPLTRNPLHIDVLRERRRGVPPMDPDALRRDLDEILDPRL